MAWCARGRDGEPRRVAIGPCRKKTESGAGSLLKRCPRMECMAELTPERLWPALEEVLLSWHVLSRSA